MRRLLPALVLVLALGAGVAHAGNGLLYLGAGLSNDSLKDIAVTNSNLDSTSWKVWAGVRPISLFAVEADYMELGSQTVTPNPFFSTHLAYHAFGVYGVGYFPIPLPWVDVFAKAGMAHWTLTGTRTTSGDLGGTFPLSDNASQFAWGIGTQAHVGNFGARLEYESFSIRNTSGANIVSLSVFLNLF